MTAWPGSIGYIKELNEAAGACPRRLFDMTKVAIDILLALIVLTVASPVILACMGIIRIASPGAVILCQTRLGKNGKPFGMYKLRSMRQNAEALSGPVLASANDQRIIPACRWMRRSHLDELPQLVNVLRGEMSLVGPRPERPEIAEQIHKELPEFRYRLQVRPGITGLAQVCNGYDTCLNAVKLKLQYDLEYISRRCWSVELWILTKTVTKLYDPAAR